MPWATERGGAFPILPRSPRFVPTAPYYPDFNGPLESDPWEEAPIDQDEDQKPHPDDPELRAELESWDAASDEALENLEDSLPE